ncbi:hypothetical protein V9T40_007825 [Parthenolecanium corni]|uniref:Uncharacterized protein n=1 Tax=Parthenolecanium corni TaxID=536013 RepID=A0AAN9TKK5_9HEMI
MKVVSLRFANVGAGEVLLGSSRDLLENVLVKMADCGSDNIGTCTMQSLFLTQNCLEKFIDNVYSVDELRDARGSVAEKKQSFCSSDESDTTEDSVSNVGSNSTESSDSAICSLDSGPEESDSFKEKCGDRYDCSESSGRSCLGFEFPSLGIKSDYAFSDLANVFKNSILQSADYECDDLDSENAVCEDDCFVDSACSSEGFEDGSDLFWREDSKTICDQKCNTDECSIDNEPSVLNDNSSSPSSCSCESNSSFNDSGLASDCFRPSASNSGLQSANNGSVVNPGSACRENIRFPSDKRNSYLSKSLCRWSECADHISSTSKLLDHLQTKHVNPQTFSETFMCSWIGCKVFGKPSCSRTWLERHVLTHVGNKPYKCIVESCGQRFSSQFMLERHINQHFKTPKDCSDGVTENATKLIRRNGQKLRYRRQVYSVRSRTDVFDAGIMSQLQYLLVQMAHRCQSVSLNVLDSKNFLHVTFQPKVIGCRQETNGNVKYLIRWYPYNTLEDEWLPESEIKNTRSIPIWKLPASVQQLFWDSVFPNQRSCVRQSRKYKPDTGDSR